MPASSPFPSHRPRPLFRSIALALSTLTLSAPLSNASPRHRGQSLKSADWLIKQALGDINAARGSAGTPPRPADPEKGESTPPKKSPGQRARTGVPAVKNLDCRQKD